MFTVLGLWSWAVQAVVVPQPVGMYITPVQEYFESDIVTVDSRALLAHEGRIRDVMAAQVDLGAYHSSLAERWLELAHEAVRLGQSESAANLFQQGLHNLRLNAGLTTDSQIDALNDWIVVLRRLGDSEGLFQAIVVSVSNHRIRC